MSQRDDTPAQLLGWGIGVAFCAWLVHILLKSKHESCNTLIGAYQDAKQSRGAICTFADAGYSLSWVVIWMALAVAALGLLGLIFKNK